MHLPPFPEQSPEPLPPQDPAAAPDPNAPVVLATGSREELGNLALLLAARNIGHVFRPRSRLLLVAARDVERSLHEWQLYAEENEDWPEPPPPTPHLYTATPATALLMVLLVRLYIHTGPWADGSPWFERGAVDSQAILQGGQWWRVATALTLHADCNHLLGNVLIGGAILHLLCTRAGYGAAWLLTILAASLANACNVIFRHGLHLSVGFSTAVFAAVGLFSGMQDFRNRRLPIRLLAPVGAGLGLLAMLGGEGERTDLGAHLFGLGCGLFLGVACRLGGLTENLRRSMSQHLAFALAGIVVLAAWLVAWQ